MALPFPDILPNPFPFAREPVKYLSILPSRKEMTRRA